MQYILCKKLIQWYCYKCFLNLICKIHERIKELKSFFKISSEEHYLFCSSFQNINMFHLQEKEEIEH